MSLTKRKKVDVGSPVRSVEYMTSEVLVSEAILDTEVVVTATSGVDG